MMAMRLLDRRVSETVALPRFHVEEQLVDIQAAAGETSKWIRRAAAAYTDGRLPEGEQALGAADTLAHLIEFNAYDLAGEVRDCPSGLNGPSGHAA